MPLSLRHRALFVALLLTGAVCATWWWTRPRRPNLLLITLDTTRADRLGAWGGPPGLTPILDGLAAQGMVFERAYAPVPITLPSHASLMTGLYPPEHGLRVNNGVSRLGSEVPVLAEILRQRGYRTGAFVGAFVLDRKFGLDRGFDTYDDVMGAGHGPTAADPHGHRMRIGQKVVDTTLAWLNGRRRQPFFCWVHLFDPHTPYSAREDLFGEQYRDRPYDAGIAYVDRQVGRLLDFLKQNGLEERTLVVVVGDHGESLGEHQERTHGYTLYDATIKVPLIFRLTGPVPPAGRVATPVSLVDVFPTLLGSLKIAPGSPCSGRSLLPAFQGGELPSLACYAETNFPFEEGGAAPLRCLITGRWKYIRSPRPELYDVVDDPRELDNLAEARSSESQALEQSLQVREAKLVPRDAPRTVISPHEQRMLASLGYTGGATSSRVKADELPDIKDLLPHFNAYSDAQGSMVNGDFQGAAEILESVVRGAPNHFQAWYNLGVCRLQSGRTSLAEGAFQRAVEIDGNATARLALSRLYLSQNKPDQAVPHLKAAVDLESDSAEGQFLLGVAFGMQGHDEEARQQYLRALELNPDFLPARQALQQLP